MEQHVANPKESRVRLLDLPRPPPVPVCLSKVGFQITHPFAPRCNGILLKLDENAFTAYFAGRNPCGGMTRDRGSPVFRDVLNIVEIAGRVDARETDERSDLPQSLRQHHALDEWLILFRSRHGPQLEVLSVPGGVRVGECLPLRHF